MNRKHDNSTKPEQSNNPTFVKTFRNLYGQTVTVEGIFKNKTK